MEDLTENIADAPEVSLPSAQESAQKPKKVIGRPITKENAKQYQLNAARAKKLRKEARAAMLAAMCTKLDLGEQLVDAVKKKDFAKISIVEKALIIVGLHYDQSEEGRVQNLQVKSKTDANVNAKLELPNLNITFEDAKPKE